MRVITFVGLAIAAMLLAGVSDAEPAYNQSFVESERALCIKCIDVYQSAPQNGSQIVSTCLDNLEEIQSIKNKMGSLTDTDVKMFYLYTGITLGVLTVGEMEKNGNKVTPAVCHYGQQAVNASKQVGFQTTSEYNEIMQNMITGFEKHLLPLCSTYP